MRLTLVGSATGRPLRRWMSSSRVDRGGYPLIQIDSKGVDARYRLAGLVCCPSQYSELISMMIFALPIAPKPLSPTRSSPKFLRLGMSHRLPLVRPKSLVNLPMLPDFPIDDIPRTLISNPVHPEIHLAIAVLAPDPPPIHQLLAPTARRRSTSSSTLFLGLSAVALDPCAIPLVPAVPVAGEQHPAVQAAVGRGCWAPGWAWGHFVRFLFPLLVLALRGGSGIDTTSATTGFVGTEGFSDSF